MESERDQGHGDKVDVPTPRTDTLFANYAKKANHPGRYAGMLEHARQLERELAIADEACREYEQEREELRTRSAGTRIIDMLMFCPRCQMQHVDAPEPEKGWTNPPHATHTCKGCGLNWRPSNDLTNGVAGLSSTEAKHVERFMAADPRGYARSASERTDIESDS